MNVVRDDSEQGHSAEMRLRNKVHVCAHTQNEAKNKSLKEEEVLLVQLYQYIADVSRCRFDDNKCMGAFWIW